MKTLQELKDKLVTIETKISRLEAKQSGGYTAEVSKSFHLGMVGGSGRNTYRLNKRRERELDKTIDRAVVLTSLYSQREGLTKQIEDIENGTVVKREQTAIDRRIRMAEIWKALKPGDLLPIGNSNGNPTIAKKSLKSVVTTGGTKWTAAEVIGRQAANLI